MNDVMVENKAKINELAELTLSVSEHNEFIFNTVI